MANTLRIKRRAAGGAAGAPSGLENAELAFNEQDDTLYYGKGTGGAGGTATQVIAIGGSGAFQPRDTDLDAIAALAANGIVVRTGNGTAAVRTVTGTAGRIGVTNGDGVSGNPTIDLATSGVTAGTYVKTTVDVYGRVTAGATASLTDLTAPSADFDFNAKKITNLADPVNAQDAATKNYVDLTTQGLDPKQSVKAASTANIASLSGTMTIDGVALIAGDRVLVKDQSTASANGVYVVAAGAWARADDMSTWAEHVSAYLFVEQGTANADNGFLCTVDQGGTLGSTSITFVQFNGAGQVIAGAGLTKTGNQLDVGAGTGITVGADSVGLTGQALALHNLATNGIFVRTGSGTVAARSVAASGSGISVSNGDGVSGNPTVSLSAALSSVGGLTPAADRLAYYTGASTAALATLTAFGRSLIDDADAAAGRTTLGLGTMATQASSNVSITGGSIDGITLDCGTF
jgi:phage-related tail fiber protein